MKSNPLKIAVFGQAYKTESLQYIVDLLGLLSKKSCDVIVYKKVYTLIKEDLSSDFSTFESTASLSSDISFLISVGGDGTMLQAAGIVRDSKIPIIGINTGRLGFLATVQKEDIASAIEQLFKKSYHINTRSLLEVSSTNKNAESDNLYALNEIRVSRKNTTTMISIDTYLDNEFLNTYWADGLIVSTPTGSTGYSLSCNGPIVTPQVEALVITPIAPHNLSIRPLIIRDNTEIKLRISSREDYFLLAMDSHVESIHTNTELNIKKANFYIYMIELNDQSFLKTLREKLLWGNDTRN